MSARRKDKINTDGGGGLSGNPFSALDSTGLPKGEPASSQTSKKANLPSQKSKGRVDVRREKAGRGGKTVTTLGGFPTHIPLATLEAMNFDLKKTCACGGTLKGRVIELQGDVVDRVCRELDSRGFRAVRAGG